MDTVTCFYTLLNKITNLNYQKLRNRDLQEHLNILAYKNIVNYNTYKYTRI